MIYVRPTVRRTETIDRVLEQLEPHSDGVIVDITSGLRDPAEQLIIIAKYALVNRVRFPEFDPDDVHGRTAIDGRERYLWARTWSRLLAMGIMINPPLAAPCEEDYEHPTRGHIDAGTLITGSPHYGGKAFDISGRPGIEKIIGVLRRAKAAGVEIKDWLAERKQGAVHVDCA